LKYKKTAPFNQLAPHRIDQLAPHRIDGFEIHLGTNISENENKTKKDLLFMNDQRG
jgi:hypothetical protein